MSDKQVADVLEQHLARMRAIGDADRASSVRLAQLHNLLIYRTATSSLRADEHIDRLVEQIVLESGATNLPSDSGSGPVGSDGRPADAGASVEPGIAEAGGGA